MWCWDEYIFDVFISESEGDVLLVRIQQEEQHIEPMTPHSSGEENNIHSDNISQNEGIQSQPAHQSALLTIAQASWTSAKQLCVKLVFIDQIRAKSWTRRVQVLNEKLEGAFE